MVGKPSCHSLIFLKGRNVAFPCQWSLNLSKGWRLELLAFPQVALQTLSSTCSWARGFLLKGVLGAEREGKDWAGGAQISIRRIYWHLGSVEWSSSASSLREQGPSRSNLQVWWTADPITELRNTYLACANERG